MKPDGKRKRRFSDSRQKRVWYALWRSCRFTRRFGGPAADRVRLGSMTFIRGQLIAALGGETD